MRFERATLFDVTFHVPANSYAVALCIASSLGITNAIGAAAAAAAATDSL